MSTPYHNPINRLGTPFILLSTWSPSNQGEELSQRAVAAFPMWEHACLVIALFGKSVHHVFQKKGGKNFNPPHIPPQQATVYLIARRAFLLIANSPSSPSPPALYGRQILAVGVNPRYPRPPLNSSPKLGEVAAERTEGCVRAPSGRHIPQKSGPPNPWQPLFTLKIGL